jgi:transposase
LSSVKVGFWIVSAVSEGSGWVADEFAVTQIRQKHSEGRAYYDKKLAEGKTRKEALRALKRQVSHAVFTRLRDDAQRAQAQARDPGGQ